MLILSAWQLSNGDCVLCVLLKQHGAEQYCNVTSIGLKANTTFYVYILIHIYIRIYIFLV